MESGCLEPAWDDDSDTDDDDDEDRKDNENDYDDMIGDVMDKLKHNGLKRLRGTVDAETGDSEDFRLSRIIRNHYKEFVQECKLNQSDDDDHPRNKRFIMLIDRRKNITKYTGTGKNMVLLSKQRIS